MAPVPVAESVLEVIKEGLALWRKYLDKKVEHYELHLKKKRMNAIKIANEMDEVVDEIFAFVKSKVALNDDGWKEYYTLKKKYVKLDKKFDKIS